MMVLLTMMIHDGDSEIHDDESMMIMSRRYFYDESDDHDDEMMTLIRIYCR